MGRRETPEFAPDGSRIFHNRIIDIDILLYCPAATPKQSISVDTPELTLPHPQIESRSFVKPLLEEVL
jgi:7,8-dihydro-6-hydroxymethylpterin-pyrophosphokinase